jgi:6-phosphogluconolactonase/glucosamine-6-phosphate isomerase/deaminase
MFDQIQKILKERNILSHKNEGITIATVESLHDGFALAQDILYKIIDPKTVLYLVGGSTPKILYTRFAKEETLQPGAVAMVDERYGPKWHDNSSEKMIKDTGLLRYFEMRGIPFYPILQGKSREETAGNYDEKLRTLHSTYQKNIAILGLGTDGHISIIPPNRPDFENPMLAEKNNYMFVGEFNDPKSDYKEQIGITFLGLSMLDVLLVLVFGDEKKKPLELLFTDGKEEEIPARFFRRPEIAKKTLLITDQSI